jgi:cyanophycinase
MAPGLGLIHDVIVDQHFAERGRFGRLIGAVAHNPRFLGMGIDENTAAVVEDNKLEVIGEGAVYIVDGSRSAYSNVGDAKTNVTLAMHNLTVHVLAEGNRFDLETREPSPPADEQD